MSKEGVSTHSIRYRILKAVNDEGVVPQVSGFNPFDPIQDTERSQLDAAESLPRRFNPFDPIQDTERGGRADDRVVERIVSTHSIRYRILKAYLDTLITDLG